VRVVARAAQALELLDDRRPVVGAPAPHALDERLAAERLPARALPLERLLDLAPGCDPRVVGPGEPAPAPPAHRRVPERPAPDQRA